MAHLLSFFTVLKILRGKVLQLSNKAFLLTHVLTSSFNLPFNFPFLNVNCGKIRQGFGFGTQLIREEKSIIPLVDCRQMLVPLLKLDDR